MAGGRVPRRLVLAGGGHAHLAVLAAWIIHPPQGVETWLVTSDPKSAYSGMIPGWMAGFYADGSHLIDLAPLAARAGVRLVIGTIIGLNAAQQQLELADGTVIAFDLLSLAIGGEVDTSCLAMLGDQLLPVRPMNAMVARWPIVLAKAAAGKDFRLVVVGGGAAGVELALAAQRALARQGARPCVTLVHDTPDVVPGHAAGVGLLAKAQLVRRGVALVHGHGVGTARGILMEDGQHLPADCVIAATGGKPPYWLKASGLALDAAGFVAVGADLRSLSHPAIFAAGDICSRADRPIARSGVHAVKAGPVLAANLRMAVPRNGAGRLQAYQPRRHSLYLLATADRRAILSYGRWVVAGRLAFWLKDWIDRRFVAHYARLGRGAAVEAR